MERARECVARGAAWLDENKPGWRESVDPKRLNIESPDICVIGQVFREEYRMDGHLYASESPWGYWRSEFPDLNPVELGFDGGYLDRANGERYVSSRCLQAAWVEYLTAA